MKFIVSQSLAIVFFAWLVFCIYYANIRTHLVFYACIHIYFKPSVPSYLVYYAHLL